MKKWSIYLAIFVVFGCSKTSLIEPLASSSSTKLPCEETSVFEFSNTENIISGNSLKYTYSLDGKIIGLDEGKSPNNSYDFKYDKSSLTLLKTWLPTKIVQPFIFQLNKNNDIVSYESKKDDDTTIKGKYEYDNENRLIKFSVTYSSINNPAATENTSFVLVWKNGSIENVTKYTKWGSQVEKFEWKMVFENQEVENVDTDKLYKLVMFNRSSLSFEGYIYLDYIGINKGKMPQSIPKKIQIFDRSGSVLSVSDFSYKFDKFNRITNVKVSDGFISKGFYSFNYLCN